LNGRFYSEGEKVMGMMKEKFLRNRFVFLAVSLTLFSASLKAVVNWHDSWVTADVVNEDLDIIGTNTLQGDILITATSTDVNVTVTNGDAIVTGTIFNEESSRLCFVVDNGYKIIFTLDDNLYFKGADNVGEQGALLISVSGDGEVVFNIGDGKKVSFTSFENSAGVQLYVIMRTQEGPGIAPTLRFDRINKDSDEHVEVQVGPRSLISYISRWSLIHPLLDYLPNLEKGLIVFDPGNALDKEGRMVLRICDTGGMYVGGIDADVHYICDPYCSPILDCPILDNINTATVNGLEARMIIENGVPGGHSSLLVLNGNAHYPDLLVDPFYEKSFGGSRYGFILGPNGVLRVDDDSYLDYVGLTNNVCLCPDIPNEVLFGRDIWTMVKRRNPSAFIVDGEHLDERKAKIELGVSSAIYFRSGVSKFGQIHEYAMDGSFSFTVDTFARSCCEGEMVFDVEGELDIIADEPSTSAIEILSLEVDFKGGSVLIDTDEDIFPLRTFRKDCCGHYMGYNKAYAFFNNRMNLYNTVLKHTDMWHKVCESNDVCSEPTYVGGEKIKFCRDGSSLPKIAFYNSDFYLHTSAAVTGLDLIVPNVDAETGNEVDFKFFYNGSVIDDGSGRNLILGTCKGARSCDGTIIDADAHLDIMQETLQTFTVPPVPHDLYFRVAMNDDTIIEGVPEEDECGQLSLHTIFLGHTSNMTIGGEAWAPGTPTSPSVSIDGNFFSFETRGGDCCSPENAASTGQGGIFVDRNGSFSIGDQYRANMSAMVVKSENGSIYLPRGKVFFDNRVGIADWNLDLATTVTIIPKGTYYTDYTLNWLTTTKDYFDFCPYQICCVDLCGDCPAVAERNITAIPIVMGEVDQLQIKGSRLSSPAHFMVDGGRIREVVFLTDYNSGEAPTAIISLQNEGRAGIGSTHKNPDSLWSSTFLGVNGITLIPNGDCQVDINEDFIINNICHILKGPEFEAEEGEEVIMKISSDCQTKLRVLKDGILDLTSFTQPNQVIEFGGSIKLILEPGCRIRMGGGKIRFTDNCQIICPSISDLTVFEDARHEIYPDPDYPPTITDDFRVDFIGTGTIEFEECSCMNIQKWAYVGFVSIDECALGSTDLTVILHDKAHFVIGGSCEQEGGVLQIGDSKENGNTVDFKMIIDGEQALFEIGKHSFFGLAVGMVDNTPDAPNDWLVDNLYNVQSIDIQVRNGTFTHNRIYSGEEYEASLLAIGDDLEDTPIYSFGFEPRRGSILGGGNMAVVDYLGFADNPIVGSIKTDYANIMASKSMIYDLTAWPLTEAYAPAYYHKFFPPGSKQPLSNEITDFTGAVVYIFTGPIAVSDMFSYLGYPDVLFENSVVLPVGGTAIVYGTAGPGDKNMTNVGYVDDEIIYRFDTEFIDFARFRVTENIHSLALGAVELRLKQGETVRFVDRIAELP